MTNRLELNWKLDGFVDEQRYYCSETPIDPANLPAPKAVLANDVRSYVDAAVDVGKTYYVCVGSVKNSVEKLSEIGEVFAGGDQHWSNVVSLLHFDGDFTDVKSKTWTVQGNPSFIEDLTGNKLAQFNSTSKYISTSSSDFFDFSDSFTCEFFTEILSRPPQGQISSMLNIGVANTITLYAGFGINSEGKPYYYEYNNNYPLRLTASNVIELSSEKYFTLCFDKPTNTLFIFIDGIIVASQTMPAVSRPLSQFNIGSGYSNYFTNFAIREFRYTKGVCRYTSDFTPPIAKFPDF